MNATRSITVDVVSDVVCPWCYVGKRRLEQALERLPEDLDVAVRWRPYELNPGLPREGMDRREYCIRKFGSEEYAAQLYANVAAHAAADGLPLEYRKIPRTPNTRPAHRLIWLAEREGHQDALVNALFAAYFVDGRDIGDVEVLADAAAVAGFDRDRTLAFLASDEGEHEIVAEERQAIDAGVQGVPAFFVNGRFVFSGAQSPETIAQVIVAQAGRAA